MGIISFIGRKFLAIGCLLVCVILISFALPLVASEQLLASLLTFTNFPPLTLNIALGGISLIIAVVLFFAAGYYWRSSENED